MKYGVDVADTSLRVSVTEEDESAFLNVRTSNRAEREHIEALRKAIAGLKGRDRELAYQEVMRASTLHPSSWSGLGIVRIYSEGEMEITAEIEGDVVSIDARTPVTIQESA